VFACSLKALFGFAFSEKLIPGESAVWKIQVFDNPDYFEWILYLTYKMT
jgi:hypothetical protein